MGYLILWYGYPIFRGDNLENNEKLPIYSYSKVKSFYNCPFYFFKNYLDRPEDFVPEGHGTSEFGSYVHKILEMYEKGELGEYELLPYYEEHYDENVKSTFLTYLGKNFSKDLWKVYYEGGKKYFENFSGFEGLKILESEYEFFEKINNSFIFTGKIDIIALDESDNLIIIDHKSKGKFKNKSEREEYSKQLYLYAYAVFKKYKKYPQKLVFNMFRSNEWIEFKFSMDKYIEVLDWFIKSVNEIECCMEFPPNADSFFCNNFCTFRNICEYKVEN